MLSSPRLRMTWLLALLLLVPAGAQDSETLIQQLIGKIDAPQRSVTQLKQAYQEAVAYLLPLMAADDAESRYPYQIMLQDMGSHASRPGAETERRTLALVLVETLEGKKLTPTIQYWIVLQLQRIGDAEVVPALTELLDSSDRHLRDYARRALEINPDLGASMALAKALSSARDVENKQALIRSLGVRGDSVGVTALTRALADPPTAAAAVDALTLIGNEASIKALLNVYPASPEPLSTTLAQSLLTIAQRKLSQPDKTDAARIFQAVYQKSASPNDIHLRVAALNGLAVASPQQGSREIARLIQDKNPVLQTAAVAAARLAPTPEPVRILAEYLPKASKAVKIQILGLLGDRGTAAECPAIQKVLNQDRDESVRVAAVEALAAIGESAQADTLLKLVAKERGAVQKAVHDGLVTITGAGVGNTIRSQAAQGDMQVRVVAIGLIGQRRMSDSSALLKRFAWEDDSNIARAALKAMEDVAGDEDLPSLVKLIASTRSNAVRSAAVTTLRSTVGRSTEPQAAVVPIINQMKSAGPDAKAALLTTLSATGGSSALKFANKTLKGDPALYDAALRTLCDWPDAEAAPILLQVAGQENTSLKHHVLAMRGIVRLAKSGDTASLEQRASLATQALESARRPDEKKMAIAAMGNIPSQQVAQRLMTLIKGQSFKNEAALALVDMAGNMLDVDKKAARALGEQIRDMNLSAKINERAERIMRGRK